MFKAFDSLTGAELRFFKIERVAEAWDWIRI
jgi:hypothetical protein